MKLESTRILRKLDGFSVLLAFVMATAFQSFYSVLFELSNRLTSLFGGRGEFGSFYGPESNWQNNYLNPVVNCVLWLVAIEVFLQIVKFIKTATKNK